MAGAELARRAEQAAVRFQPAVEDVPADVHRWRMLLEQAELLRQAGDMIARSYRDKGGQPIVAKIVGAGIAGQSFGWDVMTAMRMGHVIDGGYQLTAQAQAALIRRAGHRLSIVRRDDGAVVVAGTRRDTGEKYEALWNEARARSMPTNEWVGESGNRKKVESNLWEKWEKAGTTSYMLVNRGLSEVARFLFSDLTLGMAYAEGELPDEMDVAYDTPALEVLERTPVELVAPAVVVSEVDEPVADVNLFGEPADPPVTTPPWADWGRAEWANHCAGRLSLPEITRTWKLRNFDAVVQADEAVRAEIYDKAASAA